MLRLVQRDGTLSAHMIHAYALSIGVVLKMLFLVLRLQIEQWLLFFRLFRLEFLTRGTSKVTCHLSE